MLTTVFQELRPALSMLVILSALTGIAYPLAMTGVAQLLFPVEANGSLIDEGGKVRGSLLIGQAFTSARYFQGRPSAAGAGYDGASSSGSNLGPTSAALIERIKGDLATRQEENPGVPVPIDLRTASGSGLDPHISPEAAAFQVPRVAQARGMPPERIHQLIVQATEGRSLGILGEPRVNVLQLNLLLDEESVSATPQ